MLSWLLCGGAIPVLLIACGGFFTVYLGGQPLRSPKKMWRAMITPPPAVSQGKGKAAVSPFRAVTLALAGTLGVGNIVGVANAVWIGGAGAVLWMWVSALFAMVLKYAEILLAVRHRREGKNGFFGGAIYYIRDYFEGHRMKKLAGLLSAIFAALMILDALGMGCIIQVNAVSMAARGVWGVPTWICGVLLMLLTIPVLIKGTKSVATLTELLVPIMTAGYILLSAAVLIIRREALGGALGAIFKDALRMESAAGGVIGFLTSRGLRVGTMRGLLSNEAGCGTAPTAHAAANAHSPAAQGVWGMFEVFVDTILLCSATALVILVNYPQVEMLGSDAVMMTIRAYSCVLGDFSEWFFGAAVFCFGYATVLCWANYGMECLSALTDKKRWHRLYLFAFAICTVIGAVMAPGSVWSISDFAISALTTLNLCMLILMRREIKEETRRTFSTWK